MNSLLVTLLAGAFILIGILLGYCFKKRDKFIDISIGLAFSVMVILAFSHILPECYEALDKNILRVLIYMLIGFMLLRLLDHLVPHHEHEEHSHKHECHSEHLEHVGILTTVAIVIHNIIEGMTLYITSNNDFKSGILLAIAIGLHNIPLGIMISSTLKGKKEIIINSIILTLSTFIGGLVIFTISSNINETIVGCLLAITVGMISYIIKDELLPSMIKGNNKKHNFLGMIIGIIILILSHFIG